MYEKDELAVMKQLSEIGSVSASIVLLLQLARAAIKEAYQALRDSPEEQQNLTEILSATRFKTYHKGRVYHIKCPKKTCFIRDSFDHMLDCYSLREELKKGPEAPSFLTKMAKVTCRPKGSAHIPMPETVTADSRREDAALLLS